MTTPYEELIQRWEKISNIRKIQDNLRWDQEVVMPNGGSFARSDQQSVLASIENDLISDHELREILDNCKNTNLNCEKRSAVREIRREHNRTVAVPQELTEKLARKRSEAQEIWREARKKTDFQVFAPILRELIDLQIERANYINPNDDVYNVLFRDGEPYLEVETVEEIYNRFRTELAALIENIRNSNRELPKLEGNFGHDAQISLSKDVLDVFGYPQEHGRLDVSSHPFTSGHQFDTRITTRINECNPFESLLYTIHEFGHATYQHGLPNEKYGNPLGEAMHWSYGLHESQSRFWENHIGKSRAFWNSICPLFSETFPKIDVDPELLYQSVNRVKTSNPIRLKADELTYHFHIIVRVEIQREIINGKLDVEEIPYAWEEKMDEYLDIKPKNDNEGCLQDIHWAMLNFVGFNGYTIGSILAAQLYSAMRKEIDINSAIESNNFDCIHSWLTENIHTHGKRYPTPELIKKATGNNLTADYFLNYTWNKYSDLYNI